MVIAIDIQPFYPTAFTLMSTILIKIFLACNSRRMMNELVDSMTAAFHTIFLDQNYGNGFSCDQLSLKGVRGRFAQVGSESYYIYINYVIACLQGVEEEKRDRCSMHALSQSGFFDNYCCRLQAKLLFFKVKPHLFAATNSCFKCNACTALFGPRG